MHQGRKEDESGLKEATQLRSQNFTGKDEAFGTSEGGGGREVWQAPEGKSRVVSSWEGSQTKVLIWYGSGPSGTQGSECQQWSWAWPRILWIAGEGPDLQG